MILRSPLVIICWGWNPQVQGQWRKQLSSPPESSKKNLSFLLSRLSRYQWSSVERRQDWTSLKIEQALPNDSRKAVLVSSQSRKSHLTHILQYAAIVRYAQQWTRYQHSTLETVYEVKQCWLVGSNFRCSLKRRFKNSRGLLCEYAWDHDNNYQPVHGFRFVTRIIWFRLECFWCKDYNLVTFVVERHNPSVHGMIYKCHPSFYNQFVK